VKITLCSYKHVLFHYL